MTRPETTIERVGPYRVVRRLATGGTSDVLLAKAEGPHGFERHVVLKILLSEFGGDEEIKAMFVREASAYGRLSHPAVVRLFDFFALPRTPGAVGIREGQLVMVLEHVDGPALSRLRSMLKAVGRELTDEVAIYIAMRIFAALAAAHGATSETGMPAPVIHRDVNPSNVLVAWDGEVKLADFGVAKVTGSTHQSVAGLIRGTYGYMAPEQVTGGAVTPRADVYAAGIILWELLTKRRAFQRGALPESEALRAMAEPHLVSIDAVRPEVDHAVREALKRALEPRAERRTVTAEEMASLLASVVPADLGKERLVAALATMRDDARARNAVEASPRPSTIPPPDAPPAPAAPAGPRAGATAKIPALGQPPKLPPKLPESRPKLPAATPPPRPPPSRPAIRAASPQPKLGSTTLLLGSAPGRPPGQAPPGPKPTSGSMIETPRAPSVAMAEILRSVPSSMPPSVLGPNVPSAQAATPRMGQIPASPEAMTSPLAATVLAPPVRPPEAPELPPPNTPRMAPLARTMLLGPFVDTPPSEPDGLRFAPLAPPLGNPGPPPPAPFGPPTPVAPPVAHGPPPAPELRPIPPAAAAPPPYAESAPAAPPPMYGGPTQPAPFAPSRGPSAAPPRARSGVALYAVMIVGAALVAVVLVIGFIRRQPKVEAAPITTAVPTPSRIPEPIPTPAPTPEPAPTLSVAPEPTAPPSDATAPTATATASAAGEGVGLLDTSGASPGHRIFVDERVVAQTPQAVSVPCGKHTVRLGSAGKPQSVEVPCGGQVTVSEK
jgi:serine/threonine-protein kinase